MPYRILYTLCYLLLLPLILLWLYQPWRKRAGFGARWTEHFGLIRRPLPQGGLWLHAVSVGEVIAAIPLVKALHASDPSRPIIMTTTTRTGADRVEAALGDIVTHVYAPLDLPLFIRGFWAAARPCSCVIMETELWPNMLASCKARQIPVVLANARLSARSAARYGKFAGFSRWLLSHLDLVAAQHQDDAQRFVELGVAGQQVQTCGSIKFDLHLPASLSEKTERLRQLCGQRPTWCAASTHKGEDEQVLAAHRQVLAANPDALLVLVPRHPERFDEVARLAEQLGFAVQRRSRDTPCLPKTQVLVGDSMGEMLAWFGVCDLVFIAGSLVPVGGHNMLEPAALGRKIYSGPHVFNFQDICRQLVAVGALELVDDQQALAKALIADLADLQRAAAQGKAGLSVVEENRGTLERLLAAIRPVLS